MKYLALLRGINVGGKNLVSMAELRGVLERLGLKGVRTYIQSGNILFESSHRNPLRLSGLIEDALTKNFGFTFVAIVVTERQLNRVVMNAPGAFGSEPTQYRYDVAFFKPPVAAGDVLRTMRLKEGVDQAFEANSVLYLQRLEARARQSYFSKLIAHPAYGSMTIRNWRTTNELHRLISLACVR